MGTGPGTAPTGSVSVKPLIPAANRREPSTGSASRALAIVERVAPHAGAGSLAAGGEPGPAGSVPSSSPRGDAAAAAASGPRPWGVQRHPPYARVGPTTPPHTCLSSSPSQTIPSTSPRSPFSPATTPAAASGSRTPRWRWCRSSGRSWPRSTDTDVPGSGCAGKEQPRGTDPGHAAAPSSRGSWGSGTDAGAEG